MIVNHHGFGLCVFRGKPMIHCLRYAHLAWTLPRNLPRMKVLRHPVFGSCNVGCGLLAHCFVNCLFAGHLIEGDYCTVEGFIDNLSCDSSKQCRILLNVHLWVPSA